MTEEWRSHPRHLGIEVSSSGGFRSYLKQGPNGGLRDEPKYLRGHIDPDGYRRVSVKCDDGKRRIRGVHQILAEVFLPDSRFEGAVVRHKDDNPYNNDVSNLEWGTPADNTQDRVRNKGLGLSRSADEIRDIRRLYEMGFTQREIARVFRTTQTYVHKLVTRQQRKDVA